ncbi:hypothetical protein IT575_12500 [bacterium]|nr:hypothetical protein [bacterium]
MSPYRRTLPLRIAAASSMLLTLLVAFLQQRFSEARPAMLMLQVLFGFATMGLVIALFTVMLRNKRQTG